MWASLAPVEQSGVWCLASKSLGCRVDPGSTLRQHRESSAPTLWLTHAVYFIYMRVRRPELALHNPNLSTGDLSKLLGKEWNSMTPDQKAPWNELAERLMRAFKKKFPDYQYERGGTKKLLKKQRARSAPNALALITSPRSMAETAYRVHGMHPYHHARVPSGYQLQQPLSPHDAYYQQQQWEAQQHSYVGGASYSARGGLVSPTAFPVYGVSPLQHHQQLQQQQGLVAPVTTPPPSYASASRLQQQQQQQHYHLAGADAAGAPAPTATSAGAYNEQASMAASGAAAAAAVPAPLGTGADQPGHAYFPAQYAVAPPPPESAAVAQGPYAVSTATYAHYMPPLYAAAPTAPPVGQAPSPWDEYMVQ